MASYLKRVLLTAVSLIVVLTVVGCAGEQPADEGATQQPPAAEQPSGEQQGPDGTEAPSDEQLAQDKCTTCHPYDRVEQADKDRAGWESTVDRMIELGAQVNEEEKQRIVDYLAGQDQ